MGAETTPAFFDVDNRFMTGEYVGADGLMHHGTLASSDSTSSSYIRWSGDGESGVQTDGSLFSFDAVVSSATVEWEGLNTVSAAHFVSDPRSTSHSLYAAVGRLKNGVFYRA